MQTATRATGTRCRIGVVAPGSPIPAQAASKVQALAAKLYPGGTLEIEFHPQCFASDGHFAGDDEVRMQAFVEIANDEDYDAVWCARGGYGACRIAEAVVSGLAGPARQKAYLGYSDAGMLLAGLYRAGYQTVAHGPMAADILRDGGEAAVGRALAWLVDRAPATLEPTVGRGQKTAAFNMTVLSHLLGTPLEPDLGGHVLMLEEISEAMYRIDRSLFHITSSASIRGVAGLMLGRCSDITPNKPDFAMHEEDLARYWCARSEIRWLGRADIGHDVENKIVPFGSNIAIQISDGTDRGDG